MRWWELTVIALGLGGCGGSTDGTLGAVGGGPAGGSGGALDAGTLGGNGGALDAGPTGGSGGALDAGPTGGSGGVDCVMAGCAPPTLCSVACVDLCGCCGCEGGTVQNGLECVGGCWDDLPCDPARETNRRAYVGTSADRCAVIDFACEPNTYYFINDCGCGCEQDPSCLPVFNCMPMPEQTCDVAALHARCPFSAFAY